jgi:hypothetical protein
MALSATRPVPWIPSRAKASSPCNPHRSRRCHRRCHALRRARLRRSDAGGDPERTSRAARIKDLFFNPRFTRLRFSTLGRSERIRVVMADLIATQGYRDLEWRLARTLRSATRLERSVP